MATQGQIITFYSYKGGVGRSLLVANMAVTLASWGKRVICIDWDLEAPGLSLYFQPYVFGLRGGLLDLTEDFQTNARISWRDYITSVQLPHQAKLDFIAAGSAENYSDRIQKLSWDDLFESHKFGDYLEGMRRDLKDSYDFVLIDSRTGFSDVGGICAIQLPDILLVLVTPNNQSINGTVEIAKRIPVARDMLVYDRLALPIVPVLSRFDAREERELGQYWLKQTADRLSSLYKPWLPVGYQIIDILERTTVPYVSSWNFGEKIPYLEERSSNPESVNWSFDNLTALMINGLTDVADLISDRDSFVRKARTQAAFQSTSYDVYISATQHDVKKMTELAKALLNDGLLIFTNDIIRPGEEWVDQVQVALRASSHLVLIVGESLSKSQQDELETFLAESVMRDIGGRVVVILTYDGINSSSARLSQYPQVTWTTGLRAAAQIEIALSLRWRGDFAQWLTILNERENTLGPDHPAVIATCVNLAEAYREAAQPDEALALQQRVLAARLQVLGPDHPDTLATRYQIAREMAALEDHAGAEAEFRDILAARLQVLGPDHPDTLATRYQIAREMAALEDHAGAEAEFRDILAARLQVLGPDHPDTLATRYQIAREMAALEDHAGAEAEFRDILAARLQVLGPDHPDTLATRYQIAREMAALEDHAGAEAEFRDILAARLQVLGPDHPDTLATRNQIAREMAARGAMVERWRVVQVVSDKGPDNVRSHGSGYLIAPGRVLTAGHIVAEASVVRLRLDVGQDTELDLVAESWWTPEAQNLVDFAVVMISENITAGREFASARFGRISDRVAILEAQLFGFPHFKNRTYPANSAQPEILRDFEQVTGHVPVAPNRRQGTLAIYLDDPPPLPPAHEELSPWEGMSGAPVWVAGRIVGVMTEHHPGDGIGGLTAHRIDQAYEKLSKSDLGRLAEFLRLPSATSGLPDVVSVPPGQLVQSAYLAQVRDIAPDSLIGREEELAEWAEFCAGADPYAWWQGAPWVGKSALASWFVLHPPAGLDVVSFFITGRLYGQADSDAFLDAMIEQLSALYPVDEGSPLTPGAKIGAWLTLLASAASRADERGRRLVVVVDGLDEDEAGAAPTKGRPSIASLLPRRPKPSVRFIVTSRPNPGLPDDLTNSHPLRSCTPRHLLASPAAEDLALRATQELRDLLAGDQTAIDIVSYIAASGGGLTRSDLSALTGAPPHKLDSILRGEFGRSLIAREPTGILLSRGDLTGRVYTFAHETLRVIAEQQLGDELVRYRQTVHEWMSSYTDAGWPDSTPTYAIRSYPRLLVTTTDVARLSILARDPNRHGFLYRVTGSDYAALTEIKAAQSFLVAQPLPDLQALAELAAYRYAISVHNQYLPAELTTAWARLGLLDHAEALARSITSPEDRARALASLAAGLAQAGDLDRAEALARSITSPEDQARALASLAAGLAQAGDPDRAEALARSITSPEDQARALADLAVISAQAGDLDRAEALARSITSPEDQARALADLAVISAQAGDLDRAEALARSITSPEDRARALASLAAGLAQAGDLGRAEALARSITSPEDQARALADLAVISAQAGDPDRAEALAAAAEALARSITSPDGQARALASLAAGLAQAGDPDRAEALARSITSPEDQARALADLAVISAQAGDPDRAYRIAADAETLARSITSPEDQARALASLAAGLAQAGDPDRAEALARSITSPEDQARALADLAVISAQAGDPDRAEALARSITSPEDQARALASLADISAQAGDPDRAYRIAADAETLARSITSPEDQARALASLAAGLAQAGDPDRAEALARSITSPEDQARALADLAVISAQAGDLDRAEALARSITSPEDQARALADLAVISAQAGDPDRAEALAAAAEALARSITSPEDQARALADLAVISAQAGDPDRAYRIAADAETLARSITSPEDQARALASLAAGLAQAGDPDRAEALARSITSPDGQARALASLAAGLAQAGDPDRAEALARSITSPEDQARALADLAVISAQAGDPDRAYRIAADAETLARSITSPEDQARALASLAAGLAQAGDPDRAEALARSITSPDGQARALASLATGLAQAGDRARAARVLAQALVIDSPGLWWVSTASDLFPSVAEDAMNVLAEIYAPQA